MNTDMNQYLTFWCTSTVVRKMTAYLLCCAGLAHSPFVLTEHISNSVYMSFELKGCVVWGVAYRKKTSLIINAVFYQFSPPMCCLLLSLVLLLTHRNQCTLCWRTMGRTRPQP